MNHHYIPIPTQIRPNSLKAVEESLRILLSSSAATVSSSIPLPRYITLRFRLFTKFTTLVGILLFLLSSVCMHACLTRARDCFSVLFLFLHFTSHISPLTFHFSHFTSHFPLSTSHFPLSTFHFSLFTQSSITGTSADDIPTLSHYMVNLLTNPIRIQLTSSQDHTISSNLSPHQLPSIPLRANLPWIERCYFTISLVLF